MRTLAISKSLVRELERHVSEGYAYDVRVFTSPSGKLLRLENFRNCVWKPALNEASICKLTPQDLHHTAVSLWIRQGASPKLFAYRAGHSSVAYVYDTYGHLFDNEDAQLAAKLDKARVTEEAELRAGTHPVNCESAEQIALL